MIDLMTTTIHERLNELGLELPPPLPAPRSRMKRMSRTGDLVYLSGNGPFRGDKLEYAGKLGLDFDLVQGQAAAALTALNMINVLLEEGIDLERVRWVKVLGMVNSHPSFTEQHLVMNGFSETILDVFGEERGLHARSACGMASMPWDMAVEIEAICEIG
jgi:enamine deaminase RidA (YjgF/YER057c/UK114 family)